MGNRYEIMKSMHTIICAMNNEDAYSSWIYIVPDEASDDDLMDIATDDELFADACAALEQLGFKRDAVNKVVNALLGELTDDEKTTENLLRKAIGRLNSGK